MRRYPTRNWRRILVFAVTMWMAHQTLTAQEFRILYYNLGEWSNVGFERFNALDQVPSLSKASIVVANGISSEQGWNSLAWLGTSRLAAFPPYEMPDRPVLLIDTTTVKVTRHLVVSGVIDVDVWVCSVSGYSDSITIACPWTLNNEMVATADDRRNVAIAIRRALWNVGGKYVIASGPLAFRTNIESGLGALADTTGGIGQFVGLPLRDPAATPGQYFENPDLPQYDTYCTRFDSSQNQFGLVERRDYMFVSDSVMANLAFKDARAFGNQGMQYGMSVTFNGAHATTPFDVLELASDHLPVMIRLQLSANSSSVPIMRPGADSRCLDLTLWRR